MHVLGGWNRPVFIYAAHKKKAKACNSAGLNNKAKWSKQNVAKWFCKVRNHAQCFTLITSLKYHYLLPYQRPECCFKSKIFSGLDRDMTTFRDLQGPRPRRGIGIARPRHSKTCLETETRLETSSSDSEFSFFCARVYNVLIMEHNFHPKVFQVLIKWRYLQIFFRSLAMDYYLLAEKIL